MSTTKRRIGVAMTGASGAIYGLRLLSELLRHDNLEIHFTFSPSAAKVLQAEHDIALDVNNFKAAALQIPNVERLMYHRHDNVAAPLASGSFRLEALAIVPCSMGCIGAIAHGLSDNLVERAADVMLKERRKLLVVPREMPLSAIHLENLLTLSKLGATVMPASPGFYGRPQSVDDMVDFVVARVLDHLDVPHNLGPRWGEAQQA